VAWPGLAASRPTLREPAGAGTRAHGVITAAMAATVARPPLASPRAIGGEVMPCSFGRERRERRERAGGLIGGSAHGVGPHGGERGGQSGREREEKGQLICGAVGFKLKMNFDIKFQISSMLD
jgi:hypothetical protein